MTNERAKADMATMLEGLQEQLSGLAQIQQRRAMLTGSAVACDKRISVTVNADGVLVETRFADDIGDLTFDEIASAMTSAVQEAAADVARQNHELMAPLLERKSKLPPLSSLVEGAPDLDAVIPVAPPASLAPPGSPERVEKQAGGPMFSDTVELSRRSVIVDSDW
ncbi:YbaB/EbfC family nucleoid-associated protein [Nocardia sp. NPDC052566]|uniref:YbaB/EbfC family nucleoid-associated protein n=1 Tax=Nocardia sp. NPDC052566 TaxID=3364330 RepID=UPI0037CA1EBE